MEREWYEIHDNMVLLVRHMASSPLWSKDSIAEAVEKPWKYRDAYEEALTEADAECDATYGKGWNEKVK